jgi:DNA-binding transcriptional LysR family regulator
MPIFQLSSGAQESVNLTRFAQVNGLPTAIDLALRHMGIVLLPDISAKPLVQSGALVHLLEDISGPHWPVHILHAYQGEKPVHITRFHQLVKRYFTGLTLG